MATKQPTREPLTGNDLRTKLMEAMQQTASAREILKEMHKDDVYGQYFEDDLIQHIDQLTKISLSLGKMYGYVLADDILEERIIQL